MSDDIIEVQPFATVKEVHELLRRNRNLDKQEEILRDWALSIIINCEDQVVFDPHDTEQGIKNLKQRL